MNNSEKAKEIAENSKQYFYHDEYECGLACTLRMAQWKDERFSKFLLWLDDNYVIRKFDDGEPMTYAELIDNFKSNSYEHNTTKTD